MKKKYSNISLDNLKVLCYIINEYKEFDENLEAVLKNNTLNGFVTDIERAAQGKLIVSKDNKKFYNENKGVIEIIRRYSKLPNFIFTIENEKDNLEPIYNYLEKNKESVDKMLELIEALKEMGFYAVNFNEKEDFTNKIYQLSVLPTIADEINFVHNPVVVPCYEYDVIKYKTEDSPYVITQVPLNCFKIALNSLTFDKEMLPKTLEKKDLRKKLENQYVEEKQLIRDSVDLSVGINDLKTICDDLEKRMETLKDDFAKKDIISFLTKIKEDLSLIEIVINEHDMNIEANYPLLTTEYLDKEKDAYEKRRHSHIW